MSEMQNFEVAEVEQQSLNLIGTVTCLHCGKEVDQDGIGISTADGYICEICSLEYRKCDQCNEETYHIDLVDVGSFELCPTCADLYIECVDCGELHNKDNMSITVNGEVCLKCIDNYIECADCGELFNKEDILHTVNGDVCPDCASNYTRCHDCEEYIPDDELILTAHGYSVCESCYHDDYITCVDCGDVIRERDSRDTNRGAVCSSCIDDYITCDHCGNVVHMNDGFTSENMSLCYYCYDRYYCTCDECGDFVHQDNCHSNDNGVFCENCWDGDSDYSIHSYSHKPTVRFYGSSFDKIGIELEVVMKRISWYENSKYANDVLGILNPNEFEGYVYAKQDSSINDGIDGHGFELVSHACDLEFHLNTVPWKEALEFLTDNGYLSHKAGTCGLHVHFSKRALGDDEEERELNITKVLFLVEKYWDKLVRFSRRTQGQLDTWANRYHTTDVDNLNKIVKERGYDHGRYCAVNLRNSSTIEFRLWRGTLKYNTFAATLQMVQLIVDTARELSTPEISQLTWDDFKKRGEKYSELISYFAERGI